MITGTQSSMTKHPCLPYITVKINLFTKIYSKKTINTFANFK